MLTAVEQLNISKADLENMVKNQYDQQRETNTIIAAPQHTP